MKFSVFTKSDGILTKQLRIEAGNILKDSSMCRMAKGTVQTVSATDLNAFHNTLKK